MSVFSFELPSGHTPEQVRDTLALPIPPGISKEMYHGLAVTYEGLSSDDRIQPGARQSVDLSSGKFNMVRSMVTSLPESIAVSVTDLTETSRQDVFDEGQVVEGTLTRSVREEEGSGILVVEGELVIGDELADHWPSSLLGDLGDTAIYYGIRRPNEVMLERIPEILE
jgi:hypothetical protein